MDVGDDESGLIHSKFRKAQRKVVSRLSTEFSPPGSGDTIIHSTSQSSLLLPHPPIPRSDPLLELMYVDLTQPAAPPSTLILTPNRLQTVITGTTLPKSPIFGTNVLFSTNSIQTPNVPLNSPVGGCSRQTTTHPHMPSGTTSFPCEVFRFDSTDRERYLCSVSEEEEVFSPEPSPSLSTHSYESPQIVLDTISPLRIQDSPPYTSVALTPSPKMESQNRIMPRVHPSLSILPPSASIDQSRCLFGVPSSPVSPLTPNTPLSPSPLFNVDQTFSQGFLAELYRRRCHSDSDLPMLPDSPRVEPTDLRMKSMGPTQMHPRLKKSIPHPLTIPCKGGSLESEQSSPQDSPLDLSVKGSRERFSSSTSCESLTTNRYLSSLAGHNHTSPGHSPGVNVIRGDIASPTTRNSVALRYNLEVSPVVEEMPHGGDVAFVCPACGQMFSLHDRLMKHIASRHPKGKSHDSSKNYPCEVCNRTFARSDMLTRHARLHSGIKPYTCKICGQVFSRSDHLSTHQRTHTGEKPYRCPVCPYSACRRDMITRHLRTHTRSSSSSLGSLSTPTSNAEFFSDDRHIKVERPPSSNSSFAPDSPLSPALHISALSVNSPSPI